MFPTDANTQYWEQTGAITNRNLLSSGNRTLLGITFQQSGTASNTNITCGTNVLAQNYGKDFNFTPMAYHCNDTVNLNKTGQDSATVILTYVDRDTRISTSTGTIQFVDYAPKTAEALWQYGQVLTIVLLLITFYMFWQIAKNLIYRR